MAIEEGGGREVREIGEKLGRTPVPVETGIDWWVLIGVAVPVLMGYVLPPRVNDAPAVEEDGFEDAAKGGCMLA